MRSWRTAAISVALFVATIALVVLIAGWLRHDDSDVARPKPHEVAIGVAARMAPEQRVAVRGYVFLDAHVEPLLCSQRRGSSRLACAGDVLQLEDLDTSRLALERAKITAGGYDAWSTGEVVLLGTTDGGGTLRVQDVLPG